MHRFVQFAIIVTVLIAPNRLAGQDAPPPTVASAPTGELTAQTVDARIQDLGQNNNLAPEVVKQAQKLYEDALGQLKLAAERRAKIEEWRHLRETRDARLQDLRQQLESPIEAHLVDVPSDASLETWEQALNQQRERLSEAEKALAQLETETATRAARRAEVPKLADDARHRKQEVEAALEAPASPGAAPAVVEAEGVRNRATKAALDEQLAALEVEIPTYDATSELHKLEQQVAARQLDQARQDLKQGENRVAQLRQRQAQKQVQQAKIEAAFAHPALEQIADENLRLTRLRTGPAGESAKGLAAKIKRVNGEQQAIDGQLERVKEIEADLGAKLGIEGIASLVGPLLLEQRSSLPHTDDLRREITARQTGIALVRFQLTDIRRQLQSLNNLDEEMAELKTKLDPDLTEERRSELLSTGRKLLDQQRALLEDVQGDYEVYFRGLNDLNAKAQQLVSTTTRLRRELDQHLLWTRTAAPLGSDDLSLSREALGWLLGRSNWWDLGADVRASVARETERFLLLLLFVVSLLAGHRLLGLRLRQLGSMPSGRALASYGITARALVLTLLLSAVFPASLAVVGWWLYSDPLAAQFTRAVGVGQMAVALALYPAALLHAMLRPRGLAESHFRWGQPTVRLLKRPLRGAIAIGVPIVFVVSVFQWYGNAPWQNSLGRLLFVVGLIVAAVAWYRMFRRPKPSTTMKAVPAPSQRRRMLQWLPAIGLTGVALLATAGYYTTAVELGLHAFQTFCLAIGLVLFQGMALRWLRLVRGRLALSLAEEESQSRATTDVNGEEIVEAESEIDLAAVNVQTRQLLHGCVLLILSVGLWLIWFDVLPGTQWLEHTVWSTAYEVTRVVEDSGPNGSAPQVVTEFRVVTVSDLLLAVLVAIVAFVSARNIPGLLQVAIPQSVPLDEGARFALISLIRYLIVAVGIVACFVVMGIGWSRIQWLIAALSVGIGFGMQELVANFVSGLIMLIERPVRVGDTVTVDDITGTVTRIKIRATTIRSWDRQEYLVPNKDLITGRVLNWTLSDKMNRVTIPVGVSYSSDPRQVRSILVDIVTHHPNVLKDPAPLINFEEFGDSSLNFVIRAYLSTLDARLDTINELHTLIHERFAAAGIEIPFPQRDLHVRSIEPPLQVERHGRHPSEKRAGGPDGPSR